MGSRKNQIQNPILRGFHPDPCICRAKGKYYIVTSTFEWLPGVSLYESEDLVNWKSLGGILDKLNLEGIPDSAGIWAPALSYYDGIFYLIYTISKQIDGYFKDVENYVTTAEDIEGPWSQPVFVNASGFDPSIFHENGRHYILNPLWDHRPLEGHKKFNGLTLQEFDFEKGMTGEARIVYEGSGWGSAEGPHIMKINDDYYILSAEGGTGRHHSICVARSKNIWGPYEISPYTPMITAWEQDTILKKSGHGNLVQTEDGEWYLIHLCGRYLDGKDVCVLGRETSLQKVKWEDGWPRLVAGNCIPQVYVDAPCNAESKTESPEYRIDFTKSPEWTAKDLETQEWLSLRQPMRDKIQFTEAGLLVKGNASLTSTFSQSLIARRLESVHSEVDTTLCFRPYMYSQTAGLTLYYNTKVFHYFYVGYDEREHKRILSILTNDNFEFTEPLNGAWITIPETTENIHLKIMIQNEKAECFYAFDAEEYRSMGITLNLSILSDEHANGWAYTGTVAGITAVDTYNKDTWAVFKSFHQKQNDNMEKEL